MKRQLSKLLVADHAASVLRTLHPDIKRKLRTAFQVIAYCFMPDHLHLLCEGLAVDSSLTAFVHDAKLRSGYTAIRRTGHRLWQEGFYDHVLRDEDAAVSVVRYIVANPVRAGLAREIGKYPFCGSDVYSMDEIRACLQTWEPRGREGMRRV